MATAPAAPTGLTAAGDGTSTFNLSWTAPTTDKCSAITGYQIQQRTGESWADVVADTGNDATTYAHTGQTLSTARSYRVRAINSAGGGAWSDIVNITVPGAPENLQIDALVYHVMALSWEAPTNDGGSAVTSYTVEWSTDNSDWNELATGVTIDAFPIYNHLSSLLTPGETFYYRVRAVNMIGTSSASLVSSATAAGITTTGIPTSVTVTQASETSVTVTWAAPTDLPPGKSVQNYWVYRTTSNGDLWELLTNMVGPNTLIYTNTGLTAGTNYGYRVLSLDNDITPSDLSSPAFLTLGVPGAPTGLSAMASGQTQINLSWTAPTQTWSSMITGYQIEVSTDGGTGWTDVEADTLTTNYAHTGLTAGTTYHYRVSATNSVGTGAVSSVANATTTAATRPGPPTSVRVLASGNDALQVVWGFPESDGGSAITGYRVEWSADETSDWQDVSPAHTGTRFKFYIHRNLGRSTTRHYRVYASNTVGEGLASSVAMGTTNPPTVPDNPRNLSVTAVGRTVLRISWTAPTNDGGAAITGYRVEVSNDGNAFLELVGNTGTTATTYIHRGRSVGETRYYRVYALNSVGRSLVALAPTASGTTVDATMMTVPGDPTGLTATASGRTLIQLTWAAPADNGGDAITGYRIEVSSDGSTGWTDLVANTANTARSYRHRGLAAGSTRHYRVRAINGQGTGIFSTSASATTVDGSTATVPSDPTGLMATANGPTTIDLSWTAPANNGGSSLSGYRVEWSSNGSTGWADVKDDTESTVTTYSDTGLLGSTTRYYRVRAINTPGQSLASAVATATTAAATPPTAPTMLTATAADPTTIKLTWGVPTSNGGAVISGYQVEWSPNGNAPWTELVATQTARTYSHTGLSVATTYHYQVRAINSAGAGVAGTANTTTEAMTIPGAPTAPQVTASGRTILVIEWDAPTNTGGVPITSYTVEFSFDGTGNWYPLSMNQPATTAIHTGLVPSTRFYYRIFARNSVGVSTAVATANGITDNRVNPTIPSPPPMLTATASGRTLIQLSWAAPADDGGSAITGYRIEVSTDGGATWSDLVANTASTDRTYRHRGLVANTTRHYRVRARNSRGQSLVSTVASATTVNGSILAVPSDPTDLGATVSGQTTINLRWTAPTNNGGSTLSGYKIEVSTDGTTFTTLVASHSGTSYSHTGLSANVTRYYQVRAVNTTGNSLPSNIASATTGSASVPDAPTGLSATPVGQTQIDLEWTAPSNTGGSPITGYRIQVSTDEGASFSDLVENTGNQNTSYSHTRLALSTTRQYRVYARNVQGQSTSPSNTATATTQGVTAPDAPMDLTVAASGRTILVLSWTAPSNTGGAAITGYRIEISTDGGTSYTDLVANTGSTATTYVHRGLDPSTTRQYRVSARNSQGAGAASVAASGMTIDSSTLTVPSDPTALTAMASGRTLIQLTWAVPNNDGGSAITGYRIQISTDGGTIYTDLVANTGSTETSYIHRGLSPNTTRHYQVSAINRQEGGSASEPASATTVNASTITIPSDPTRLMATASGQTTINLRWDAPANNGGSAITGYRVEWSPDGRSSWTEVSPAHTGTGRAYSDTGLAPNTTRYYRVYAINAKGNSSASETANATTGLSTEPPTAMRPGPPTALTITAAGRTILQLAWTAPADDGESAITGYIVDVSSDGSMFAELARTTELTYLHRGLNAGTTQHYQIRAVNAVGAGPASDAGRGTTPAAAAIPSDPTDLVVESSGRTLIVLRWTAPADDGGAAITGYQIEVGQASESNGQAVEQGVAMKRAQYPVLIWKTLARTTETHYVHRGLAPGVTRYYRVQAINSVGGSLVTAAESATTDDATPTIPSDPLELRATLENPSTVTLGWHVPADDGGSRITGYRIEVSTDGVMFTELVASQLETTYTDTRALENAIRYYQVLAINAVGKSLPSNVAQVGEVLPTLSFGATSATAPESAGAVTIPLSSTIDLPVQIRLSGTASPELDYLLTNTSSSNLMVTILDDDSPEDNETIVLTLIETETYRVVVPRTYTLTITDDDEAVLGFAASVSDQSWIQGLSIEALILPAAVHGRAPYTYTLTPDLPAGTRFDATTRKLSGIPGKAQRPVTYTYTVTDTDQTMATLTFTIKVVPPAALIFSDTVSTQIYPVALPLADQVLPGATGGGPPYSYTLIPKLPTGLAFDSETRTLSGTPSEVTAVRTYTYAAEDRAGMRIQQNFNLEVYQMSFSETVADQSWTRAIPIDALVLPEVTSGVPPVKYTLTLMHLPLGLNFDLPSRTIGGTPLAVSPPTSLTYRATDANGMQDSLKFRIEVISSVSTERDSGMPQEFWMHANYPNPFQSSTHLVFDLPWPAEVQIEILDVIGRRVMAIPAVHLDTGWNREIELTELELPSGTYLYRILATPFDEDASLSVQVGHFLCVR